MAPNHYQFSSNRVYISLNEISIFLSVVMHKLDYHSKIQDMLNDTNTYTSIQYDPTSRLQIANNKLVKTLFDFKLINMKDKLSLMTYNTTAPKLYALPKIHKPDTPMRPVVASINTPSSRLSKWLSGILRNYLADDKFILKNSFDFRSAISVITVEPSERMVSFDIISLFTNIPVSLAMDIVVEQWDEISTHTNIPKRLFLGMLRHCMIDANYFVFNGVYYKQIFGMPMGNALSSVIADIVTSRLLMTTLNRLSYEPKIVCKYVDDIFTILPLSSIEETLLTLNSFHPRLQCTIEKEVDGKIPYLDVLVLRNRHNTGIHTDWYRKSICSNRILNYYTHHPKIQKHNTARNFTNRVLSLSSPIYYKKNQRLIYDILSRNNYPHNIIQKIIASELTKIGSLRLIDETPTRRPVLTYKGMTYVSGVSERIEKVVKMFLPNTTLAYRNNKTLRRIFSRLKDPIPDLKKTDVIYMIPCLGSSVSGPCTENYVGQTKQYLEKRLQNHRRDLLRVNDPSAHKTALMDHYHLLGHKPDFESASILASQSHYSKRLTIEALHIYTQNTYNIKRDTDGLAPIYCSLIDDFSATRKRKRESTITPIQHNSHYSTHSINTVAQDLIHPPKRRRTK